MRSPKEKAEELVFNFCQERMLHNYGYCNLDKKTAVQCALITVNEVRKVVDDNCLEYDDNYWDNVAIELRKL